MLALFRFKLKYNKILTYSKYQSSRSSMPTQIIFSELMVNIGALLECDRCFLYLRDPATSVGRVEFCWIRDSSIPKIYDSDWKQEPTCLSEKDPMFAAALRTEPSIFVEDVKTESSNILSQAFEESNFGHRALIHAHLCQSNQLWGVLQPCIFKSARKWREIEKKIINQIVLNITPIAVEYILANKQKNPDVFE
jgi:GAF domain-containing protein